MKKSVSIIGAGIGGLTSAIYLAKAGLQVDVFEKNLGPGGKVNELVKDGFRFDLGPSIITMPFVFEEIFEFAGENLSDYFEFQKLDVICKYFWEDGRILKAYSDVNKMAGEIRQFSKVDADNYRPFLDYSKSIYDYTKELFLFEPFQENEIIFKLSNIPKLFNINKLDAFNTVNDSICKYFSSPEVIQIFNRYATYNGSNPFVAPATLNIIPWVEYGIGGYYIKGGIYKLALGLERLAKELGARFHYESDVQEIVSENGSAKGIRTNSLHLTDYTLANSDTVETANHLNDNLKKEKLNKLESSLSGMVFLWGVDGENKELDHHNILFSKDYEKEFDELFNKLEAPEDPTVYISITSKKDNDHSPNNCENWFVLVNMPYLNGQDWVKIEKRIKDKILEKLKRIGIDLTGRIKTEEIINPEGLYKMYRSNKGSIYGISSNDKYSAFLRPRNRSKYLKNLYFAGGSSHPGGGIPLVALSGKIASKLILKQEGIRI